MKYGLLLVSALGAAGIAGYFAFDASGGECSDKALREKVSQYDLLMRDGKAWDAASMLRACIDVRPKRIDLQRLVAEAEIWSHEQTIENQKIGLHDRVRAIGMLQRDYPEAGKKYARLNSELSAQLSAQQAQAKEAIHDQNRALADRDPINAMTSYATVLGRGIGCGIDASEATRRVGKWMDQAFPPGSPGQGAQLLVFAAGMRMNAQQQREGKSPDSCETVQRNFQSFPWP